MFKYCNNANYLICRRNMELKGLNSDKIHFWRLTAVTSVKGCMQTYAPVSKNAVLHRDCDLRWLFHAFLFLLDRGWDDRGSHFVWGKKSNKIDVQIAHARHGVREAPQLSFALKTKKKSFNPRYGGKYSHNLTF